MSEATIQATPAWLVGLAGAPRAPANTQNTTTPFKLKPDAEQLAEIRAALEHLKTVPAVAGNKLWSDIGYTLLCLGNEGRSLWCDWSERAPGYSTGAPEHWWDLHGADAARSDFRHLFTIAQQNGWINPRSHAARVAAPIVPSGTVPPPPTGRFKPVEAWAFADGPDPRWRVRELLPEQGLAMIYGQSGAGKSFYTLDLVMSIARGTPYGIDKRAVTQGRVVYIMAEGAGGFRQRLRAYRQKHGLTNGDPAPKFVTAAPNFMLAADVDELQAAILEAGGADIIVIDTLHASTPGADENSAKDMGLFLGHCRALQAATGGLVILIHHSGKDEERGARGSSSLRAAVDTEIEVSAGSDCCMARVTKQRDGADNVVVCFRLADLMLIGGRHGRSAVVEHIQRSEGGSNKARQPKVSEEQQHAVEQVRNLLPTYPNGVQLSVLQERMKAARGDKRQDSLNRSITRAIDAGLLTIDEAHNVRLPVQAVQRAESFLKAQR